MSKLNPTDIIYVALINENVDVWRPVRAEKLRERVYRILKQPYDTNVEKWEFEPGEIVQCEYVESEEGSILAAKKRVEGESGDVLK